MESALVEMTEKVSNLERGGKRCIIRWGGEGRGKGRKGREGEDGGQKGRKRGNRKSRCRWNWANRAKSKLSEGGEAGRFQNSGGGGEDLWETCLGWE